MREAKEEVTLQHEKGLHARPGSLFVQTASDFDADITVGKAENDKMVNGKSSIDVLSLGAEQGDTITIQATNGEDSEEAVQALATLIEDDFEKPTE